MDVFALEIGRWIGETRRDVRALQEGFRAMKRELQRLRRFVMVIALLSTSATGLINRDMLSTIIADVMRKMLIGL